MNAAVNHELSPSAANSHPWAVTPAPRAGAAGIHRQVQGASTSHPAQDHSGSLSLAVRRPASERQGRGSAGPFCEPELQAVPAWYTRAAAPTLGAPLPGASGRFSRTRLLTWFSGAQLERPQRETMNLLER